MTFVPLQTSNLLLISARPKPVSNDYTTCRWSVNSFLSQFRRPEIQYFDMLCKTNTHTLRNGSHGQPHVTSVGDKVRYIPNSRCFQLSTTLVGNGDTQGTLKCGHLAHEEDRAQNFVVYAPS